MSSQPTLFDTTPDPWELDARTEQTVAEVVFSDPPFGPFDYLLPPKLKQSLTAGQRVQVPLGKGNRAVVGFCIGVAVKPAGSRPLKELLAVVDDLPLVTPAMLRVTQWMADYYLTPLGQVLQTVVPAGVRSQAGTREMTFLSVPPEIAAQIDKLQLPPKQRDALKILAAAPRPLTPPELAQAAKCTLAPIGELRKKKLVSATVERIANIDREAIPAMREDNLPLHDDQQQALNAILAPLRDRRHETILIHGVTGSGKTEVYIRAIDEVVRYGRQAIVLVPEISLTPQTRRRFRARFGRVAVLHSGMSDAERHWHWRQIAAGEVEVVIGARSAVFAPTPHLGMIVVDEEHDASFKQGENPRYHARDVACERARLENIPLVLGSATPSLESWRQTVIGAYRLVDMPRRVEGRPLPDVGVIDLRQEIHSRTHRGAVSRPLHMAIDRALADGGQVILLLNRRGYSTHIQCPSCGYVAKCPNCDLALTHHRDLQHLVCHYCDHQESSPARCPDCKFDGIRYSGLGTEKLEAEVKARFQGRVVLRMDSDTMQRPGSHEEALDRFRRGEVDVLLGTQMIAKGLDFPNVTLVGVINADSALHFADFRAAERTFQLVTQVAGRTGRGAKGGRVLVQTLSPEHYAIEAAVKHDYAVFAEAELPLRESNGYPPYTAMLRWIVRSDRDEAASLFAQTGVDRLRAKLESSGVLHRLLGPAPCPIARLRGKFRYHALLTGPDGPALRKLTSDAIGALETPEEVQWVLDVDPVDML